MKPVFPTLVAVVLAAAAPLAQASMGTYNVITTWYEPETRPNDSIFIGSFTYDSATKTVTNLQGKLSESMTGDLVHVYPNDKMTWLDLNHQLLVSWHDVSLGGTFAAAFKNTTTDTFVGGTWSPQDGVDLGGIYAGWPKLAKNPGNAYALIFVPDSLSVANNSSNPLTLHWQEGTTNPNTGQHTPGTGSLGLAHTAYADCAPGGMMGAVCMTATSVDAYGAIGTMSGVPYSQTITAVAAPVPEPETYALMLAGLGLTVVAARRRRQAD